MTVNLAEFSEKDVPMLLLPYQQQWIADKSSFKNYTKSRRIGISWADAAGATLKASETNGRDTFYIGYEKQMARGYIEDCAAWAKLYGLACSEIDESDIFLDGSESKAIFTFRIHFNSGFKIQALSSNPRNMRSRQGDFVLDEAAFVDGLGEFLKAAKAMRIWGGRIRLITTLNGIDNEYYELDQQIIAGKMPYSRHFTTFIDAVHQGLFKRICLIKGEKWSERREKEWVEAIFAEFGEDAGEELMCIARKSGGNFFSRLLLESCMELAPVLHLGVDDEFATRSDGERWEFTQKWIAENLDPLLEELDIGLKHYFGMDFARNGDLSYILVFQENHNLVRECPFAIELRNIPFRQQEQILFHLIDRLPRFMAGAMDARGNGQALAEYTNQRYGSRIEQVKATETFYAEWFPKYRAGMQDNQVILPRDSDLLADHRLVMLQGGIPKIPDSKKNKSKKDGEKRHGDGAIAGLLAYFASCMDVTPMEYRATEESSISEMLPGSSNFGIETGLRGWQ